MIKRDLTRQEMTKRRSEKRDKRSDGELEAEQKVGKYEMVVENGVDSGGRREEMVDVDVRVSFAGESAANAASTTDTTNAASTSVIAPANATVCALCANTVA